MAIRKESGGHPGPALANAPEFSPLTRLIDALRAEKTRFMVVGMTAAVLQGTPVTTFDVDLWIDLPSRQYMQMINLSRKLGAEMISNTIVIFPGDVMVNFIYEVTGLNSFRTEYKNIRQMEWMGRKVAVLPLDRICASKKSVGRPKDLAHLVYLEQTMALTERVQRRKPKPSKPG